MNGKRKYSCRDCGHCQLVHWVELNRRSGPRCVACGGFLEPYSEGAKEDRIIGDRNVREHHELRGDIIKGNNTI